MGPMLYTGTHTTWLGGVTICSDGDVLRGRWFDGQRHYMEGFADTEVREVPFFDDVREWVDSYLAGRNPEPLPYVFPDASVFRDAVWHRLEQIPYGQVVTYGEIASELSEAWGRPVSARAVGGAVGTNPLSMVVPCHRVVGSGGRLTGYAGGLDRKRALLEIEGVTL